MIRTFALEVTVKSQFRQFTVINFGQCKMIRNAVCAVPVLELAWCTKKHFRKGDPGTLSMNIGFASGTWK